MVADADLAAGGVLKGGRGEDVEGEGKHSKGNVGVDDKIVVGLFARGGGDAVTEPDAPAIGRVGASVLQSAAGHVKVAAQDVGCGKLSCLLGSLAGKGQRELGADNTSILLEKKGSLGISSGTFFGGSVGRQVNACDHKGGAVGEEGHADGHGKGSVSKVGGADAFVRQGFGQELEGVAYKDGVNFLGAVGGGGAGRRGVGEAVGFVGGFGIVELVFESQQSFLEKSFAGGHFGEHDDIIVQEFFDGGGPRVLQVGMIESEFEGVEGDNVNVVGGFKGGIFFFFMAKHRTQHMPYITGGFGLRGRRGRGRRRWRRRAGDNRGGGGGVIVIGTRRRRRRRRCFFCLFPRQQHFDFCIVIVGDLCVGVVDANEACENVRCEFGQSSFSVSF